MEKIKIGGGGNSRIWVDRSSDAMVAAAEPLIDRLPSSNCFDLSWNGPAGPLFGLDWARAWHIINSMKLFKLELWYYDFSKLEELGSLWLDMGYTGAIFLLMSLIWNKPVPQISKCPIKLDSVRKWYSGVMLCCKVGKIEAWSLNFFKAQKLMPLRGLSSKNGAHRSSKFYSLQRRVVWSFCITIQWS